MDIDRARAIQRHLLDLVILQHLVVVFTAWIALHHVAFIPRFAGD
nr:hypothetical protein [Shinella sp. CPCC 101442]